MQNIAFAQSNHGCPVLLWVEIAPQSTTYCEGDHVKFDTGTGSLYSNFQKATWQWYIDGVAVTPGNSDGSFTTDQIPSPTDSVWVVYTASLNDGTCPSTLTSNIVTGIHITPKRQMAITITSSQTTTLCLGSTVTFAATPMNGGNSPDYVWQVNGVQVAAGKDSTFTTTTLKDGDEVNCLLYIPDGICLVANDVPSNTITARFFPPIAATPSVTITASANDVYHGTPITFTAATVNAGANTTYQWQVNGVNAGTDSTSFTTGNLNNGDQVTCMLITQEGCTILTASNAITVTIKPPPPITAPNTFTPNGDGINDTWKIYGLSFYPNIVVKVFNRYGAVVYQSHGYSTPWDGTGPNKRPLPDGVYYYLIYPGDKSPEVSGWLAIIR